MKLSEAVQTAYKTHWSYTNNFHVIINWNNDTMSEFLGWNNNHDFDLNTVSFDCPQFQTTPIEVFTADRWVLEDGAPEPYMFSLTIRDQDNLKYYRTFLLAKVAQQKLYFDDYAFTVHFYKDSDYKNESDIEIFQLEGCKIESIGQLTFSNEDEAKIAQFTVECKCVTPSFNTGGL